MNRQACNRPSRVPLLTAGLVSRISGNNPAAMPMVGMARTVSGSKTGADTYGQNGQTAAWCCTFVGMPTAGMITSGQWEQHPGDAYGLEWPPAAIGGNPAAMLYGQNGSSGAAAASRRQCLRTAMITRVSGTGLVLQWPREIAPATTNSSRLMGVS